MTSRHLVVALLVLFANFVDYVLWSLWLLALAALMLRLPDRAEGPQFVTP